MGSGPNPSPCALSLQVAIKNNVDVFYFSCLVPMHVLSTEDGLMDKRVFLATWKDIPAQNEVQYTLDNVNLTAGEDTPTPPSSLGPRVPFCKARILTISSPPFCYELAA